MMTGQIRKYIKEHRLLNPEGLVVVGLSGGADSVALLHLLVRLGYSCLAAHCNFHLRGEESDGDERFAAETARKLNVPFLRTDFQTEEYAHDRHISIEMAARDLRYAWFEEIRSEHQAQAIAVAHHRDDSAETFLLNLCRGSGIRGLCGIRPKNGFIVRPLLCIGRDEILSYLKENQLTYVTDSTNSSDEYTRNFIRLRVLPLLEEINPSVKKAIARTADHLTETEALFRYSIENAINKSVDIDGKLLIDALLCYPSPKTILYEWLNPYGFTPSTIDSVYEALDAEPGKIFYSSGESHVLLKDRDFLMLSANERKDSGKYFLQIDQPCVHPIHISFRLVEISDPDFAITESPDYAFFDKEQLSFPLYLRKWQPGDWFIPFGMKGRKKLSNYFTDHKFSRFQKEQTWLLCSGTDIIWIVGERTDNRFRITKSTKSVLIAFFSR